VILLFAIPGALASTDGSPDAFVRAFPGLDSREDVPRDARYPVYTNYREHTVAVIGPDGEELPGLLADRDGDWYFYELPRLLDPETEYTAELDVGGPDGVYGATFTTGADLAAEPEVPDLRALTDLGWGYSSGCAITPYHAMSAEVAVTPPDGWSWVYLRDSEAGVRGRGHARMPLADATVLELIHEVVTFDYGHEFGCFVAVVENAAGDRATTEEVCFERDATTTPGTLGSTEPPSTSADEPADERGCSTGPVPGGVLALGAALLGLRRR
jgi:hypothetical protein